MVLQRGTCTWILKCCIFLLLLVGGHPLKWHRHRRANIINTGARFRAESLKVVTPITSAEDWDNVMSKAVTDRVMIIDFQKSQCKPCKKVAPEFEKLAEKYADSVNFFKVDADSSRECLALMKQHGIRSVPTFYVFVGSARVDSVRGAHIDLVEDCIIREQLIIDKNARPGMVDETVALPPDDDTEKAMSRENAGHVETVSKKNSGMYE